MPDLEVVAAEVRFDDWELQDMRQIIASVSEGPTRLQHGDVIPLDNSLALFGTLEFAERSGLELAASYLWLGGINVRSGMALIQGTDTPAGEGGINIGFVVDSALAAQQTEVHVTRSDEVDLQAMLLGRLRHLAAVR